MLPAGVTRTPSPRTSASHRMNVDPRGFASRMIRSVSARIRGRPTIRVTTVSPYRQHTCAHLRTQPHAAVLYNLLFCMELRTPRQRRACGGIDPIISVYQGDLRTVHYRFHPRAGEEVEVVRRHERKYLVVRQPDRTLAYLPEWMTSPRAASCQVREVPALPREALSELRAVIDAFFLSAKEPDEGGSVDATAKKDDTGRAVQAGEPHDHDNRGAAGPPGRASRRAGAGGDDEPGRTV